MTSLTSLDLWENIKERFAQLDGYRIADLQTKILTISQGTTIIDYFAAIQVLWDELTSLNPLRACVCEGCFCNIVEAIRKKQEVNLVICFSKGLNASFSSVKSQIMATEPLPSMNRVFALLLQYKRELSLPIKSIMIFKTWLLW